MTPAPTLTNELKDAVEPRAQERTGRPRLTTSDGDRGPGWRRSRPSGTPARAVGAAEARGGRGSARSQTSSHSAQAQSVRGWATGGPARSARSRGTGPFRPVRKDRSRPLAGPEEQCSARRQEGAEHGGQGREPVGEEAAAGGGEAGVADPLQGDRRGTAAAHTKREEVMQDELAVVGEAELGQAALPDDEAGEQRRGRGRAAASGRRCAGAAARRGSPQPARATDHEDRRARGPASERRGAGASGLARPRATPAMSCQRPAIAAAAASTGMMTETRRALLGACHGASVTNEPDLPDRGRNRRGE
jgi:hypothetical protein